MAEAKVKNLYNRATGVHVQVSADTWESMNQADWAPATDATRKATREAAEKYNAAALSAAASTGK